MNDQLQNAMNESGKQLHSKTALVSSISTGVFVGFNSIAQSAAFAALMFSGDLSSALGFGVPLVLLATSLMVLVVAWRASYAITITGVQEAGLAIVATTVSAIVVSMPSATPEGKLATAIAIYGLTTITTGILFWCVGYFRLGKFVYLLPYPVVAGFLAGSGWLLIGGGMMVITNVHPGFEMLRRMASPNILAVWIPALAFSVIFLIGIKKIDHLATAPLLLVGSLVIFHLFLLGSGISGDQARSAGWLAAQLPQGEEGITFSFSLLGQIEWARVVPLTPMFVSVGLIHLTGFLLNTTGLELATRSEFDVNNDLRATALSNFAAGAVGGPAGFTSISLTMLGRSLGAKDRSVGYTTSLVCLVGMFAAPMLLRIMPIFLMAGLLMYLGIELLWDWGWKTRLTMPRAEWIITIGILLAIMFIGFMPGIGLGLVLCLMFFIWTYSMLPIVRVEGNATSLRSLVNRAPASRERLLELGDRVYVLGLQGYLFFANADRVFCKVKERLDKNKEPKLDYLVLDFEQVNHIDSSVVSTLMKMRNRCESSGTMIVLSDVNESVRRRLKRGSFFEETDAVHTEPDLDHALEWCETRLLNGEVQQSHDLETYLHQMLPNEPRISELASCFTTKEVSAGTYLQRRGDRSDDVYLVGKGRVCACLPMPNGRELRLRSMTSGSIIGEAAFYSGETRTADLRVEQDAVIHCLSRTVLDDLNQTDLGLSLALHQLLGGSLVEKLASANALINTMMPKSGAGEPS